MIKNAVKVFKFIFMKHINLSTNTWFVEGDMLL